MEGERACAAWASPHSSTGNRAGRQQRVPESPSEPKPEAETCILVVGDEPALRLLMTAILEREGYRVEAVENGGVALNRLSRPPLPQLIVLDLEMPEIDGLGFRSVQLHSAELAQLPVVVCTSQDAPRYRELFRRCRWVSKPFEIGVFMDAVRTTLC